MSAPQQVRYQIRPNLDRVYIRSGDPGQTFSRLAMLGNAIDRVGGTVAAALRVD